jgi:hypothetical protein
MRTTLSRFSTLSSQRDSRQTIFFLYVLLSAIGVPRSGEGTFSISTGISTKGSRASDCAFVAWRETSRSLTCSRLNPEIFTNQFYKPAVEILGPNLSGFIFEQEYQPKKERVEVEEMAESLDTFLKAIPYDKRYHIELRTEAYLSEPEFDILEQMG